MSTTSVPGSGSATAAPAATTAGAAEAPRSDSLVVSMMSIAVIVATAVVLKLLEVPSEVTAPASTASGALVPMVAVRRRDRRKTKVQHVQELLSGTFGRPPVYGLIVAAGLLALTEWATYVVAAAGSIGLSVAGEESGVLTAAESEMLLGSTTADGVTTALSLLVTMVAAVPIGVYVAHRVLRHGFVVAIASVVVSQVITFVLMGWLSGFVGFQPWPWIVWILLVSGAMGLGVARGRATRSLFVVTRVFRRLGETDRRVVLSLIDEEQVAERLA
ncbi:hypothetical protein [Actinotalea sp. Marseille-Q4924]|uniref:hypothetical protein n=1 Tax=Actinotalea sp. Marseille-Q4924 TaxID=2866571 RepID=UPI001CE3BA92|nr:hypothetical protein [Actinotalea sp. Marseille-Q4924]